MDDLEKKSLTKLRVKNDDTDITQPKVTKIQKAIKFSIKGKLIHILKEIELYSDF